MNELVYKFYKFFQWCQNNLDILLFIYGLAFSIMGVSIWVKIKKGSEFRFADILWLLAGFGITNGASDFLDMWALIKGKNPVLVIFCSLFLVISYFFLYEFARRLFGFSKQIVPVWKKRLTLWLFWWPKIVICIFFIFLAFFDLWETGNIWVRYFLGFPGGILVGLGLLSYYNFEEELLKPLKVKKFFITASISFIIFGIFSGILVPRGRFFPSNWLNADTIYILTGIPIYSFRAFCAIIITWSVMAILRIFNWEVLKLRGAYAGVKSELRELEQKYWDIVENSNDAIHSVDADGFIIFANKKECELLGYSKKELIGKHISEIYAHESWENVKVGFEKLKREGVFAENNGEIIRKNGSKLDVEIHSIAVYDTAGNFLRTRTIMRDVTQNRYAERLIKQRLELEKTISRISSNFIGAGVSNIGKAINLSLAEIGKFTNASHSFLFLLNDDNKSMDSMYEWRVEGMDSVINGKNNQLSKIYSYWMSKLNNGKIIYIDNTSKMQYEEKTEKEILEKLNIKSILVFPLKIRRQLRGFTGIDNVVSTGLWKNDDVIIMKMFFEILERTLELIYVQKEKEKMREQLIQAEKMASIGILASGVAHELNNPLTAIIGNTQLLLEKTAQSNQSYKDLRDIEEASMRCKDIISNLLSFARQTSLDFETVNINSILENSLKLTKDQIRSNNTKIIFQLTEGLALISGIPQKLEQVFVNIILNAIHSMPEGGTLKISTERIDNLIEISFKDSGTGIPGQIINKIFDPFFTTKSPGKGTGLGLYVSKNIVELHGGLIKAKNNLDRGATFTVLLPVRSG